MKKLYRKISIWWACRKYDKMVKRSMKRHPKAYVEQGFEFDNWEEK